MLFYIFAKSLPETGNKPLAARVHDAIHAATGEGDPAPSDAQIAAGNYRKHHIKFQGLDITIENPRGTIRSGRDAGGHEWAVGMQHHYGYIRGTLGVDGDHLDCYIGPQANASHAYVVHQRRPPDFKKYDEDKVMLGFGSEDAARAAYLFHYDDPRFLGDVTAIPMAEFKSKIRTTRDKPRMLKSGAPVSSPPLMFVGHSLPPAPEHRPVYMLVKR